MTSTKLKKPWLPIILRAVAALLVLSLTVVILSYAGLRYWQAERQAQGVTDLRFEPVELAFIHETDLETALPFLASSAIDINGDGRDELFLGGGAHQGDQLFEFSQGKFSPLPHVFEKEASDASYGAACLDIDNDGDTDLFVARQSGVWFYENRDDEFHAKKLQLDLADNTAPISLAFGDINKDGLADLYVSGYLKMQLIEGETIFADGYGGYSHLFLNEGEGAWRDVSKEAGVWRQHNTFTAVFADLDNDTDSDLVIAQDTGRVEMYENQGDLHFAPIPNPSVYSYPMGIAVGDYDRDGLIDLFFSNVGYTLPPSVLRGDLEKNELFNPAYMLFHNDGDLKFSDVAEAANASRYGFGWGSLFADMNLDGHEDLVVAQNFARLPMNALMTRYPGKILQNYGDHFEPVEKASGAENPNFAIAPIVSDFNQDGLPDLVWANINGRALAFINKSQATPWIKIRLPNTASSLNAQVTLTDTLGHTQYKQLVTSQGMGSDQSRELIFGLGDAEGVKSVSVLFQDGTTEIFENPTVGTVLTVAHQ